MRFLGFTTHIPRPDTMVSVCLAAVSLKESGAHLASGTLGPITASLGWFSPLKTKCSHFPLLLPYNLLLPPNQTVNIMKFLSLLTSSPSSLPDIKFWGQGTLWLLFPLNSLHPISHQVLPNCPLKSVASAFWLLPPSSSPSSPHTWITRASKLTFLTPPNL